MRRFLAAVVAALTLTVGFTVAAQPASASDCTTWLHGIDVSSAQHGQPIDWGQVPSSGISFAWVKTTEGTWYKNPFFDSDSWGAASVGLPTGGYHFARPTWADFDAERQAQFFVAAGGAGGTLPPVLDLEETGGLDPVTLAGWAVGFLREVERLTGRHDVTAYFGSYFPIAHTPELMAYTWWLPAYPAGYAPDPNPCDLRAPGGDWSVWQYTSSSHIAGIFGNVDQSVALPGWWASVTGGSVAPAPSPTPTQDAAWTVWGPGSRGPAVIVIQGIVGVPQDGQYGPATAAAVRRWQHGLGLVPDGIWGPATDSATGALWAFLAAAADQPPPPDRDYSTFALQRFLNDQTNARLAVDGVYGRATHRAVASFQRLFGLTVDGIAGDQTWAVIDAWR